MKFTSTSLALLASIPLVCSLPTETQPPTLKLEKPQGFDKIQKADPEHWLTAVKEEAARQEAAAASTFNETEALEARASWIYQVHGMYTDNLVNVGDVDTFYMLWTRMYDSSDDKGGLSDMTRGAWSKFCNGPSAGNGVVTRFVLDGQWGATADGIGKKNGYTVYNNCYGFTCIIRMNVYNRDGSLRADAYQARISSQAPGSGGCSKAQTISAYVADFIPIVGPYFATGIRINCLYQN
ncbi:hypothetical protein FCIRC_9340 [Fusarium circinatum]|uniref:Uncharacterized protein n=1 Tax=Fusarium circinatum TaxID=48490 RepID=A0A8H5TGN3_FUSCI|nr:hypothetical protein FCIRC_9340 [Fusarium circinatum]